ncbi:MAG: hypothetical protein EHM48_01905 [Planctomycetaceae bacterium]|nr:MAG: hypothetical protein EHM48_01905 [Planctomycetaceae bacterium]
MNRISNYLCVVAVLALCVTCGCGVPSADGPADTFGLDFSLPEGSQTNGAIVFVVDGVNATTFQELLDAGELPAIKTYLMDRGLYVPRAASSHPSLTINNLNSLVTGRFSGHHGIPAAKSFDRNRLIFRNYETLQDKNKVDDDANAPTIYEQFPDRLTFSMFMQAHHGATHFYENRTSAGPAFFFEMYPLVDRIAMHRFGEAMSIARQYRQFPAVSVCYQLSVNFAAYKYKPSSPQYRQAIRDLDRQIGRVLGDLKRAGMLDKVVVAFVSDHGHCDTPKHGKAIDFVEGLGISLANDTPIGEETPFEKRLEHFNRVIGVPYGPGDRYWVLYLRKPFENGGKTTFADWLERPSPQELRNYPIRSGKGDLPVLLAGEEYVDAVAYLAEPGCVRVVRKGGEVEFRRVGRTSTSGPAVATQPADGEPERITYRLVRGTDPLEWAGKVSAVALAGEPLTSREWLEATAGTEFPDLPAGLLSYYDGRLAADIVVFPAPLWDFDGWRKAGHGGIRSAEVFAPLLIAGPGIPHGRIPVARTVDLVPTLLESQGKPLPQGLDGQSLIGRANKP